MRMVAGVRPMTNRTEASVVIGTPRLLIHPPIILLERHTHTVPIPPAISYPAKTLRSEFNAHSSDGSNDGLARTPSK